MKAWLKIVIKLGISIILFAILDILLLPVSSCRSTLAGSAGLPGCFTNSIIPPGWGELALFLFLVLIVWLADWIISKLRK
jgi:hypothetical protein